MKKLFGILLLCLSSALAFGDARIVTGGKAVAEIILAQTQDKSVSTAASELQKYIQMMTGAKLPILSAPSGKAATRIFVGESPLTRKLGFSLKDVKHDGFRISVRSNDIIIAGNDINWYGKYKLHDSILQRVEKKWFDFTGHKWRSPMFMYGIDGMVKSKPKLEFHSQDGTGTLYGIYHFLELFGFRWYFAFTGADRDLGKVIPQLKDMSLKNMEIKREPLFGQRIFCYYTSDRECSLWIKSQGVGQVELIVPIHLTGRMLDYREDPELAGLVGGKVDWTAPRLSGEKFRKEFMHYLDCFNRFYPIRLDFTSFGSPDGWGNIDDRDVARWDRKHRGNSGRFSDYYWDFLMDIRKRYNSKYSFGSSQRKHVYAYSGTRRIPEMLAKKGAMVPDDFTVFFCYNSDKMHLPGMDFRPELREWQARIKSPRQLVVYDYYYEHTKYKGERPPLPYIFTGILKKEFAELYGKCDGWLLEGMIANRVKNGFDGFYRPAINSPMFYLRNRMTWDRNCDPVKELEDLCRRYYGPAAREMMALYTESEKIWMRPVSRSITINSGYIKKSDVPRLFALLEKAKAKAGKNTVFARRIGKLEQEMLPLKDVFKQMERKGPMVRATIFTDEARPKVDGDLEKPFWKWRSRKPPIRMALRDMYTAKYPEHIATYVDFRYKGDVLYIAIECLEPKMQNLKVIARENDSQSIWSGDMLEIALETTNGRRPLINIDPAGHVYDRDLNMPNVADLPHFYKVKGCAVKKLKDRWCVELAIDFAELGCARPNRSTPCGIQISRQRMAGNKPEHYMLSPTGSRFNDHLEMMGNIFAQ